MPCSQPKTVSIASTPFLGGVYERRGAGGLLVADLEQEVQEIAVRVRCDLHRARHVSRGLRSECGGDDGWTEARQVPWTPTSAAERVGSGGWQRDNKYGLRPQKGDLGVGRTIADEAREPTPDVMMRARERRWNRLGHILRMEEHRVIRRVLMNCDKPTPGSLFGDVPDLDSGKAAEIAKDWEKWKSLWPSKRC